MSDILVLKHPSGATASVNLFGATVFSWILPSGKEMFYLSTLSDKTGVKPIRGGIPVVFPQFANEGPIVKHGFARTSKWEAASVVEEDGFVSCVFRLTDSEITRAIWNHAFELLYTVRLGEKSLFTELRIQNPADESFDCQCLLHTYYSVPSIATTIVKGMQGHTGVESVTTGKRREFVEEPEEIHFDKETDAKYQSVANPIVISMEDRTLNLSIAGQSSQSEQVIPDCVVWNAWIDKCHGIGDMEDEDYKRYVCVEPGLVWGYRTVEAKGWFCLQQTMEVEEK